MSQENVEIVRRMYEAFNDEGVAGTLDYYADEIVWHSDPRFPGGGTYKGKERAAEYMQSLIDYWEHVELRVEELIPKGDQVLAILTSHNVGREGVTMDSFWAHLWTVADGKMQDVRSFLDREAALQAAGLSEQAMSENVEVVRRAYEVFDTDLDALLGLLDPAIEWISPSDALEPGLRRGHKGVRDAFAATAMAWNEPTHTPEDFIDAHDKVLVTVTFRGHGRGSGMEAERTEFHIWTVGGAAIVRFQWFYQRHEALEAAGLSEQAMSEQNVEVVRQPVV